MKVQIPFRASTGKAAIKIEVPDDTETEYRMRAAVEIAIKAGANLTGANLAGANLADADLARANLADANLVRANLADANLVRANLASANLAGANLVGANLTGADLTGVNLAYANLAGADLADANLAGADLTNANLAGADLVRAYLAGANLAGANLVGANLTGGAKMSVSPLQLHGLRWPVIISDQHIQIGYEVHTTEEWSGFDNRRIAKMDGKAARQFWDQWKGVILAAADAHQSKIEGSDA